MIGWAATKTTTAGATLLVLAAALGGCGKVAPSDPRDAAKLRAEAKRQQTACGSSAAYDRLKGLVFDRAIAGYKGDRAKLDMLADYSFARMENPVVEGSDAALDIIRCRGRLILQLPPGTSKAFDGASRLEADVDYSAQAAADGSGLVYQVTGVEPIVAKLAAFNLAGGAYRPPPAIDVSAAEPAAAVPGALARADVPASPAPASPLPTAAPPPAPVSAAPRTPLPERAAESALVASGAGGEATIRAFYAALGAGDGAAASARVVPEKRAGRAFSPEAIARFYAKLPEPVRLTRVAALAGGAYDVRYRYSTGRSRCDGSAVVTLAHRGGQDLIRSIRALGGC